MKNAIKAEYDQKLETHKSQLKAQTDIEVERFRSQLRVAATEREVRFSNLHSKRAEIIAETYHLLKELFVKLSDYVKLVEMSGEPAREERGKAAAEAHDAFRKYYATKVIFLPRTTAENLEKIDLEFVRNFNRFVFEVERATGPGKTKKWIGVFERVEGDVKNALGELEDEFRSLLGED